MDIDNKNELKKNRVWIQDICKKSTVLTKKVLGERSSQNNHCLLMIDLHAM